jgi:acetoin utilization deacetylase AcuC-like enzyme
MRVFHCDHVRYPLPPGHRFPSAKYHLLRARVETELAPYCTLAEAGPASDEQLLMAHDRDYVARVTGGTLSEREVRRIGLPWSPELAARARCSVGATLAACRAALEDGVAASLSGGTHHAFADHGEGFCLFNDCAVAARAMQSEGRISRAVILDCDVHQGNGTAAILRDDPSIFTFSIHGARNFPFRKEASDLDIDLPDATGDAAYLEALRHGVRSALARSGASLALYVAGADPFAGDALGRLALSKAGLAARDRFVLETCRQAGTPVAVVMGGGYARELQDTVDIQFRTIAVAAEEALPWL